MLPQSRRVSTPVFKELLIRGRRSASPHFSLLVGSGKLSKPSQFSVVVSKKIESTAVARNRSKRKVRDFIRTQYGKAKGYVCVVFLKTKDAPDFKQELKILLDRAVHSLARSGTIV